MDLSGSIKIKQITLRSFQHQVVGFLTTCFGWKVVEDKQERSYRFYEEATELVQAAGMSKEDCYRLVDYVYDRPIGEVEQEIGGVMVTLFGLMEAHNIEASHAAQKEIASCWDRLDALRAKWKQKQIRSTINDPLP